MKFNAELISVKTMQVAGTIRLAFDVPEIQANAVMSTIMNFNKKPLIVNIEVDNTIDSKPQVATREQLAYIHILYKEIAQKYGSTPEDIKKSAKKKFLGDDTISTKDLNESQLSLFIDHLKALKES